MSDTLCGWTVGPVWKAGGEVCKCILPPSHESVWHECSCGAQYQGCGRPA